MQHGIEDWQDREYRVYLSYERKTQQLLAWFQAVEEDGQTGWAGDIDLDPAGTITDYRRALWPVVADLRHWVRGS